MVLLDRIDGAWIWKLQLMNTRWPWPPSRELLRSWGIWEWVKSDQTSVCVCVVFCLLFFGGLNDLKVFYSVFLVVLLGDIWVLLRQKMQQKEDLKETR